MPFEQVNGKVVSVPVAPGREVLARRGAMLAYTGQVQFAPVRATAGGVGGMAGRMMAGEQVQMMVAQGQGTVHYGFHGGGDEKRRPGVGRGRCAARGRAGL